MLLATESHLSSSLLSTRDIPESSVSPGIPSDHHEQYKMIPRNSPVASLGSAKISIALTKKFTAENGSEGVTTARRHNISRTARRCNRGCQEQVDLSLMQNVQNRNASISGVPASTGCWG